MNDCIICSTCTPRNHWLCSKCETMLERARIHAPDIHSLYKYTDHVRALIWAAKIRNHTGALELITALFIRHASSLPVVDEAQAFMPMPSSLWGRMRGRFDVAFIIAAMLAKAAKKQLLQPPWHLGWHTKKKSMLEGAQREHSTTNTVVKCESSNHIPLILIIDDLYTTGSSYQSLKNQMLTKNTHLLTFANAAKN